MKGPSVNLDQARSAPAQRAGQQGVGLLEKAFQLLDLFGTDRPPWTQAELARETGLARSTLSRLVRFLCARGYLLEQRGRYSLGYGAIALGRRAQQQFTLVDIAADLLEEVAEATAETAMLTSYDEARLQVVCLAQIPSRQGGLRVFENVGAAYPLYAGASAKTVLAFLPPRQIERILSRDTPPVNPAVKFTAESLRRDIRTIRRQGFAVTREETYPGVVGVGVPVLTPDGQTLGAMAVAGPLNRMTPDVIRRDAALLVDLGRRMTERLGADPSVRENGQ